MIDALVVGGGPSGLMAAEVLSVAGYGVTVVDAMPTVGRKFLMAGKSGLNLTKAEDCTTFHANYGDAMMALNPILTAFGPEQVSAWAQGLGQEIFTGSTGRVFPTKMKASPLLRAWLVRLEAHGVRFQTRWRWAGWNGTTSCFDTPDGPVQIDAKTTVLAMGGASWKRLGSDGQWAGLMPDATAPFQPANMGFLVDWSNHMAPHLGHAVKGCKLTAGDTVSRGEFVITGKGIEGGGIYMVSQAVRDGASLVVDLLPDVSLDDIRTKLAKDSGKQSTANTLRKALKIDPIKRALINELGREQDIPLPEKIKALPFPPLSPCPIDEAISTAGGVRFDALNDDLMLTSREGTYCAGEMLDWEAPTGGYLITACLATGRWAGLGAVKRLQSLQ